MRALGIALFFSLAATLPLNAVDTGPVLIQQNSGSPDGRLEIVIVQNGEETGIAARIARITDRQTGRSVGSFEFTSFGFHPTKNSINVLWRPDSRCVAVWWAATRGYTSCKLYARFRGKWVSVPLPDYLEQIRKRAGIKQLYDKGWEIPQEWLSGSRLVIEVGNRNLEKRYRVTLRVSDSNRAHRPKARIQNIEEVLQPGE
jgi:hypothetical protein